MWRAPLRGRAERVVRDLCFERLVGGVLALGADRIVVESCSQDRQDLRVIGEGVARAGAMGRVRFDVVPGASEQMLWAADIVAWAYGSGGLIRSRVLSLVRVHDVT